MRALLVVAVVILLMAFAGWIRFYSSENNAGVDVDTQEMRDDVQQAGESVERTFEDLQDGPDEEPPAVDDDFDEDVDASGEPLAPQDPQAVNPPPAASP